jgi:hypothetical protein
VHAENRLSIRDGRHRIAMLKVIGVRFMPVILVKQPYAGQNTDFTDEDLEFLQRKNGLRIIPSGKNAKSSDASLKIVSTYDGGRMIYLDREGLPAGRLKGLSKLVFSPVDKDSFGDSIEKIRGADMIGLRFNIPPTEFMFDRTILSASRVASNPSALHAKVTPT